MNNYMNVSLYRTSPLDRTSSLDLTLCFRTYSPLNEGNSTQCIEIPLCIEIRDYGLEVIKGKGLDKLFYLTLLGKR